jgi:hypothetical protein
MTWLAVGAICFFLFGPKAIQRFIDWRAMKRLQRFGNPICSRCGTQAAFGGDMAAPQHYCDACGALLP